jgi:ABC-type transport system substrate-binding protein
MTLPNRDPRRRRPALLASGGLALGVLLAVLSCSCGESQAAQETASAPQDGEERLGPGPVPVDVWNQARETAVEPAWGGTVTVHIAGLPSGLNTVLLNSSNARNMMHETHAFLVHRDWESWEFVPELATRWEVADTLVTSDGRSLRGRVSEADGKIVLDTSSVPAVGAAPNQRGATMLLDPSDVARVERGTVVTFFLREGVQWHDGHPLDVEDLLFTWNLRDNLDVRCDWLRAYLQKISRVEVLDPHTLRFTFGEQYFNSLSLFADNFIILPRHLYDLRDPDHISHDPEASDADCAKEINENVHNTEWVGLGPYRVTSY